MSTFSLKSRIESPEHENGYQSRKSASFSPQKFIGITLIPNHVQASLQQQSIIDEAEEFQDNFKLTTSFYQKLLALEDTIIREKYSLEMLLELVQLYTQAIEHYDYLQDPIKCYFLEKMQNTISKIESLKILFPQEKKEKEKDQNFDTASVGELQENDKETAEFEKQIKNDIKQREKRKTINFRKRQTCYAKANTKLYDYDLNFKRIERTKKMQIFIDTAEKQKETDFESICMRCYNKFLEKDVLIQQNIDQQIEEFEQKLQNYQKQNTQSSSKQSAIPQTPLKRRITIRRQEMLTNSFVTSDEMKKTSDYIDNEAQDLRKLAENAIQLQKLDTPRTFNANQQQFVYN